MLKFVHNSIKVGKTDNKQFIKANLFELVLPVAITVRCTLMLA